MIQYIPYSVENIIFPPCRKTVFIKNSDLYLSISNILFDNDSRAQTTTVHFFAVFDKTLSSAGQRGNKIPSVDINRIEI